MIARRHLFQLGGASVLASLVASLRARPSAAAVAELLEHVGRPQDFATPLAYFDRLITPNDAFFLRSHFGAPSVGARPLRVTGMVSREVSVTLDELRRLPQSTVTAVLQCAGNGRALHRPRVPGVQWVHGAVGQATWSGVRLRDLLHTAGIGPGAAHVHTRGADLPPNPRTPAFVRSLPLARALDPSTLVALTMNGEPLPHAHGAPFRLVVPGWAGDHWMKWLTELHLAAEEPAGFYMAKAYRMPSEGVAPGADVPPDKMRPATFFPVKSLIARPADGDTRPPGRQEVVGVAFAGESAIAKVEVSIDGGASWRPARLEGPPGAGRWQVFRATFDVSMPGRYTAMARATDAKGETQPESPPWNPSGYFWNGWHTTSWVVA